MSDPILLLVVLMLVTATLSAAQAPAVIELRRPEVPQPVPVERLGINLNYLEDGAMLDPAGGIPLVDGLRRLGVRSLRFPGGNKSDSHLWSVPPFEWPAPRLAVTGEWDWPAQEERYWNRELDRFARPVMDTDQALDLAATLDAQLVMVVAYDEQYPEPGEEPGRYAEGPGLDVLIETAAAWVRYCRQRGTPVRYWEIGNECYLHKGVTAEVYARDLVRFAEAMRAADPEIRIGANGPDFPHEQGKADQLAQTGTRWWPTVLAAASNHIDYLSLHSYPCYAWRSFDAYASRRPDVRDQLRKMRQAVERHAAPEDRERIELLITETNSADWLGHPKQDENWPHQGNIGHALVLFDMLAQYLQHDDLTTVQVWNTRWQHWEVLDQLWDALADDNRPSAIGMAMTLWQSARSHWLTAEQAGPVLAFPTVDPATGAATVFLVNRTTVAQTIALAGEPIAGLHATARRWSGDGPDDEHPVLAPAEPADPAMLAVPAAGMLIVELEPQP